jgi:glyoxylase-like metal-dependent hydrolase (beta-lactamase superfamily II)
MTEKPDDIAQGDIPQDIPYDRQPCKAGEVVEASPLVRRLIAPNGGPFTFTGTCSYLVGRGHVAVIDPGPDDAAHIAALMQATQGETIAHILVTHTHRDHSPGARRLRALTGAPILGCKPHATIEHAPSGRLDASHDLDHDPDHVMEDGETLQGDGYDLTAVHTPGHASNHLCFAFAQENALFSGDHVMAWSTTIVGPPDGHMSDYMASLEKLRARAEATYWPGHGGPVRDPQRFLRALVGHRRYRESAIVTAIDAGLDTIPAIVTKIYDGLDPRLTGAASLSVLAHLEDLVARGVVDAGGPATLTAHYLRR